MSTRRAKRYEVDQLVRFIHTHGAQEDKLGQIFIVKEARSCGSDSACKDICGVACSAQNVIMEGLNGRWWCSWTIRALSKGENLGDILEDL